MATDSIGRQQRHHADHGIPPRLPTASTPLWTHLLRTNTSSQTPSSLNDMTINAPPMAPLDKNATSMRVLLHDTQVNFEKFTTHVGNLLENITETKTELKSIHSMFEREREGMMGDIIDLVNRSQLAVQKTLGQPCQVSSTEIHFKDVNIRLEGLDQRLDALQTFNQTHSQALQTQIQAVQILLDKQGSIITAVMPLLPLLQALPLYIESAKTAVMEKIGETSSNRLLENYTSPSCVMRRKRSRTDGDAGSDPEDSLLNLNSSSRPRKRPRSSIPTQNCADLSSSETLSLAQLSSVPQNLAKPVDVSSSSASSAGRSSPTPTTTKPTSSATRPRENEFRLALTTPRRPLRDLQLQNQDSATYLMMQSRTPSLPSSCLKGENLPPAASGSTRTSSKTTLTPARVTSSSIFGRTTTHRLYADSLASTSPNAALTNVSKSTGAHRSPFTISSKTGIYARAGSLAGSTPSPMQRPACNQSSGQNIPQVRLGITPTASRPSRMLRTQASIQGGTNFGPANSTPTHSVSRSTVTTCEPDLRAHSTTGSLSPAVNPGRRFFPDHSKAPSSADAAMSISVAQVQPALVLNSRDMPPPNQPVGARSTPMRYVPSRSTTPATSIHGHDSNEARQQASGHQEVPPRRQGIRLGASVAPPSRPTSAMSMRSQNGVSSFLSRSTGVPTRTNTPALGTLGRPKEVTVPKEGRRFIPLIDSDDEDEGNAEE